MSGEGTVSKLEIAADALRRAREMADHDSSEFGERLRRRRELEELASARSRALSMTFEAARQQLLGLVMSDSQPETVKSFDELLADAEAEEAERRSRVAKGPSKEPEAG